MEGRYNLRSPAVKRLMREARELCEATSQYYAQPLEDNLFEWHFTVQGPADSDFARGRYHGRIVLPPEYPMKPPSIMLLTPNGRFEIGKKICLSMSAHHPETWQPSWSIRTVLLAIIGFMPSKGGGAIGALDYTSEERQVLARKSVKWICNVCGSCNADSLKEDDSENKELANKEDMVLASQISFKGESEGKSEKKTSVDRLGDLANGDTANGTNGQNIEELLSSQDELTSNTLDKTDSGNPQETNVARKRSRKRSNQRQDSKSRSEQPVRNPHSKGYFSLVLLLVLILCLVILLLRRIYYK